MKKEFDEFVDLIEKALDRDPWTKKRNLEISKEEILEEAKEVAEAIDKKDYKNLKEELGDLLWDVVVTAYLAERDGHFKSGEIVKSIKEKMKRRKPFIVGEKREISREEAKRAWFEAKEKEKQSKNEIN